MEWWRPHSMVGLVADDMISWQQKFCLKWKWDGLCCVVWWSDVKVERKGRVYNLNELVYNISHTTNTNGSLSKWTVEAYKKLQQQWSTFRGRKIAKNGNLTLSNNVKHFFSRYVSYNELKKTYCYVVILQYILYF